MGALTHAPRHSTSSKLNMPSAVVPATQIQGQNLATNCLTTCLPAYLTDWLTTRSFACNHVPPSSMPRCSQIVFLISSLPHTMHGVVPHSWIKYLPTLVLRIRWRGLWMLCKFDNRTKNSCFVNNLPVEHGIECGHLIDLYIRHVQNRCHFIFYTILNLSRTGHLYFKFFLWHSIW